MIEQLQSDAVGKLVLRLTVGILMLFHGVAKVLHPGTLDFIGGALTGAGLPEVLAYGVYLGEIIAPLMIILGFQARIGGLILVINMIFAIVLMHSGDLFSLTHDQIDLERVLLVTDGEETTVGTPYVEGAKVEATIASHVKGKKIVVFKYKPRIRYRVKQGHRQKYTRLKIDSIVTK